MKRLQREIAIRSQGTTKRELAYRLGVSINVITAVLRGEELAPEITERLCKVCKINNYDQFKIKNREFKNV